MSKSLIVIFFCNKWSITSHFCGELFILITTNPQSKNSPLTALYPKQMCSSKQCSDNQYCSLDIQNFTFSWRRSRLWFFSQKLGSTKWPVQQKGLSTRGQCSSWLWKLNLLDILCMLILKHEFGGFALGYFSDTLFYFISLLCFTFKQNA